MTAPAMMEDPFLLRHFVSPLRFCISGNLTPISIRDQMLRAKMFVDRACEAGLIGVAYPLLVVGAGAAGATAACYAANEKRVPTTLLERGERPFRLQSQCESRWICPTQYDWPASHWSHATYPWIDLSQTTEQIPIPWSAEMANFVALGWRREFETADPDYLNFLPNMRFMENDSPQVGDVVRARYREYTPQELRPSLAAADAAQFAKLFDEEALNGTREMTEQNFGAVLDARGFPPENVQLGDYRGLAFWDTDTFGDRNLGLGFGHASRVLIGGDGDGALQDFLRIATGKQSAAEIMKVIEPGLDRNLLREIYSEEDQAFRAKTWNQRIHDHKVQCRLDRLHIQWAGDIVKPGSYARALLEGLVKFSSRIDLDLVHPCEHFTAIYPLNRFLVYLIAAVAPASIRILPRTKVNKVTCRHDPPRGPWTCVGQEHEVELQDSPDCIWPAHNGASAAKPTPKSYDTVILRLGLERLPAERFLFRSPRQLLPYHPPV